MEQTKTTLQLLEIEHIRAQQYYKLHKPYIDRLMKTTDKSYAPSGSDCRHPELWKAANWRWAREEQYVG